LTLSADQADPTATPLAALAMNSATTSGRDT
jgi:hypothetical protein